jgi:hypothetical protein
VTGTLPALEDRMAKKPAAAAAALRTIPVAPGSTVTIDVDVNAMVVPYTIALDGSVVIKSTVDRRAVVGPLSPGQHTLGWGFAHAIKGWAHTVSVTVDGTTTLLEKRSEASKDQDHSVGMAFLTV